MKLSEYIKEATLCEKEWFPNHVATVTTCPDIAAINWRNKGGGSTYACTYILRQGTLLVTGDISEAIYCWNSAIDLAFLAATDLEYFHGKCCASETGRDFKQFDAKVGSGYAQEWLAETDAEDPPGKEDDFRQHVRLLTKDVSREELDRYLEDAYDDGLEAEDCSSLRDAFYVPHSRCIGHWVGLKMAHKQLSA